MNKAWIFTYYDDHDLKAVMQLIQEEDCLIAVDGGIDLLFKYEIMPHLIIGDFDSLSSESLDKLYNHPSIIKVAPEKDETDTELALSWCIDKNFTNITIINSMQDRFDHCLGLIAHLEWCFNKEINLSILSANQNIYIAKKTEILNYPEQTIFSLCPLSSEVIGVETINCYYPLHKETLYRNKSRGISNLISKSPAIINHLEGLLLIIIQLNNSDKFIKDNLSALRRYTNNEDCYA